MIKMRGAVILLAFLLLFVSASLLIPSPMFPGNVFREWIGNAASGYSEYLSAVFYGVFYGVIFWLVFTVISRRLEEEK